MNIPELNDLLKWIESEVEGKRVIKLLRGLYSVLEQNSQANNAKQPFEEQKNNLINALNSVDLATLTIDQLYFLQKINIAQHLGAEGVKEIEHILFRDSLDPATAARKVLEIVDAFEKGQARKNQLKTGLENIVEPQEIDTDRVLVRVNFTGDASMSNVVDFKKWGEEWHDIGRGIAMAHGIAPEEIRIVGAKKGSIVLDLAVAVAIAKSVSTIILDALKVADKSLDIRRKAEEIRGLRLQNDGIAAALEAEIENERLKGIEGITNKISTELAFKKGDGEKREALDRAVRKLENFIEKGGEVDCVVPEDADGAEISPEEKEARVALRADFQNIRALEAKMKHLEHKPPIN